jgi:hypothetical protein
VESCVISGLAIRTGRACLSVTSDEEYPVIGSSRDGQHRQERRREYRELNQPVIAEHRDDTPRHRQFDQGHEKLDQCGGDRAVDQKQHDRDRAKGERGNFVYACVPDHVLVVAVRG